ncbi:MAG: peptidase [Peptococcaceae bacterium BICA1-7]|nr:MAG: peptidase [Peptococcaceae bacterium BICA1-7]HBV98859.1 RIP metalloprotease RseP [Desulfotomaculum sp.]
MGTFLASIIVFGLLIFFHELGHFAVAKMVGIKVHEFSLGFGPKIISLPRGETAYNLRLLPLGGFVRMAGMDPSEEEEDADEERGFNKKTVLQRTGVIIAGPLMNFVLAIFLIAAIFMFYGLPDSPTTRVRDVLQGKPAAEAGIRPGDVITGIGGARIESWDMLSQSVAKSSGKPLDITVSRAGQEITIKNVIPYNDQGHYRIGVQPTLKKANPITAVVLGTKHTIYTTAQILNILGKGIMGQTPIQLGGPVQIVATIDEAVKSTSWLLNLVSVATLLSISLGLFNLFPIPALDGSRILFLLFEKLRGRPVEPQRENFIHMIGFGLLLLLIVVITYNDILRIVFKAGI